MVYLISLVQVYAIFSNTDGFWVYNMVVDRGGKDLKKFSSIFAL